MTPLNIRIDVSIKYALLFCLVFLPFPASAEDADEAEPYGNLLNTHSIADSWKQAAELQEQIVTWLEQQASSGAANRVELHQARRHLAHLKFKEARARGDGEAMRENSENIIKLMEDNLVRAKSLHEVGRMHQGQILELQRDIFEARARYAIPHEPTARSPQGRSGR